MIARVTRMFIRRYSDNGQTVAYVEWLDRRGKPGRTEGTPQRIPSRHGRPETWTFGEHMHALFGRGRREGLTLQRETW